MPNCSHFEYTHYLSNSHLDPIADCGGWQIYISDKNFQDIYLSLAQKILENGASVKSTKGWNFEIRDVLITLEESWNCKVDFRKLNDIDRAEKYERYLEKELAWYESGSLRAMDAPAKAWMAFADQNGRVVSNYGYLVRRKKIRYKDRIRNKSVSITQFEKVIDQLISKPSSRQAIIHYLLPPHIIDGAKDVPCTVSAQVFVRDGLVSLSIHQRSCDMYTGIVYDIPWHSHLLQQIVERLNSSSNEKLRAGRISLFVGSLHIYQDRIDFFRKLLGLKPETNSNFLIGA